jgi:cytochrome c551/c552
MSYRLSSSTARVTTSLMIAAMILGLSGPAFAAGIGISVGAPESVAVGQQVEVKAVLTEDGAPIEGAEVALTYKATFAGETDRVEIASATTDETGTAVMVYEQRANDNGEMQIVYLGPGTDPVDPFEFTIAVEQGGAQLYHSESGVKIPFVNGTLVILVIAAVWVFISLSAVLLVRVGKAGIVEEEMSAESGSMWIGVLLASAAIFTAVGMVIVFVRAPLANTDLSHPSEYETHIDEYDRTELTHVGDVDPYVGFGLKDESAAQTGDPVEDGKVLSFEYACAACHAPSGLGGVVGPALIGEIGSFNNFVEEVRDGPKGMPAYSESTLSEADLQKIYDFLEAGR